MDVEQMLSQVRPLDCIFFRGTDFISDGIAFFERIALGSGEWTHVGIVVNKTILPSMRNVDDGDETLYVWESTFSSRRLKKLSGSDIVDVETQRGRLGIQLRPLADLVRQSLSEGVGVGWGRMVGNPLDKNNDEEPEADRAAREETVRSALVAVHGEYFMRTYQLNALRLFAALKSCFRFCRRDEIPGEDMVFCSQFVAVILKRLGIIDESTDEEAVVPMDLARPDLSEEKFEQIFEVCRVVLDQSTQQP